MKILLVMPEWEYGGAEKQFSKLAKYLDSKHNLQLLILNSYGQKNSVDYTFKNKVLFMRNIHALKNKFSKVVSLFKISSFITKTFSNSEYDVIIGYCNLFLASIKHFKKIGKKVIYSERNSGISSLKFFFRKKLTYADYIVCNSLSSFNLFKSKGFANVRLIYNGVESYKLDLTHKYNPNPVFLCPARINKTKNQMLIVNAVISGNLDCIVLFAGEIEDKKYYAKIKRTIDLSNKNKNFVFLGKVQNIAYYYDVCDYVVLPSLSEGMPNVLLESFAHSKIPIVSSILMNKAIVPNSSLLFDLCYESLIERMSFLNNLSYDERRHIIEINHHYVEITFSFQKMFKSFENIILEVTP